MATKRQRAIAEEATPIYANPIHFWDEPIKEVYQMNDKGEYVDINKTPDSEAIQKAQARIVELEEWIKARRQYEQSKK
tara:strand:- start:303 stop:536 length:234 start_codon:yes stop_codon:yes gene_type:complete